MNLLSERATNRLRPVFLFLAMVCAAPLLSACASDVGVDSSTEFGPSSDKAIVLLGTSANRSQVHVWSGESLSTFWQEYDPATRRLVPDGSSFRTKVLGGPFSKTDYRHPSVTVLEVDPGDYALIAAGFPHLMALYVRSIDGSSRTETNAYIVDPRRHVDPRAAVDSRENFVFSVEPGEIVYIGHFEFVKALYWDSLVSTDCTQDEVAARETLKSFPGITGDMVILNLNLTLPTETAAR